MVTHFVFLAHWPFAGLLVIILATNPMNLTAVVDAVFGIVACASCVFQE